MSQENYEKIRAALEMFLRSHRDQVVYLSLEHYRLRLAEAIADELSKSFEIIPRTP